MMGSGGDSDDAMQLAFQQYMMGGASAVEEKSETEIARDQEVEKEEQRKLKIQQLEQQMKKSERKYHQLFDKFHRILRDEWFDLDDQAYQVVESIVGIRTRLPMHARLLKQSTQDEEDGGSNFDIEGYNGMDGKKWKNNGYNNRFYNRGERKNIHLLREDIQSALSHDMIQHEKMLAALRGLLANISECHEMILRICDEMTRYHFDCLKEFNDAMEGIGIDMEFEPSFLSASRLAGVMRDVIGMLSNEL